MINLLGLLGWSPGDDRDVIERSELIELFNISGIQSKGAIFDESRAKWLNGQYIGKCAYDTVSDQLSQFAKDAVSNGDLNNLPDEASIQTAWGLLHTRIHFVKDLFTDCGYMFQDPTEYEPKGVKKQFKKEGVVERLECIAESFSAADSFSVENIEQSIREVAEKLQISAGKIIHPVRLSCSGVTGGPGLFEMLEVIGIETVVRRLNNAIKWIKANLTEKI